MSINYKELLNLILISLEELKTYVAEYEGGSFSGSTEGTYRVLNKLKEWVEAEQVIDNYVLRGVKSISTAAVKDFESTGLEKGILNIARFMMNNVPVFNTLEPLRSDFSKYF